MEPLIHFVVPFTALTLLGVRIKKALPISLVALLPDLDTLSWVHRSLSHSLIVLWVVVAPLLMLARRWRLHGYVWLASLAVASHLVLDLFAGLVAHVGSSASLTPSVKLLTQPINDYEGTNYAKAR